MPHFQIQGADRATGEPKLITVQAGSESDALILANARDIAASSIQRIDVAPPAPPTPDQPAARDRSRTSDGDRPMTMAAFEQLDRQREKRSADTWGTVSFLCALTAMCLPFMALVGIACGVVTIAKGSALYGLITITLNVLGATAWIWILPAMGLLNAAAQP